MKTDVGQGKAQTDLQKTRSTTKWHSKHAVSQTRSVWVLTIEWSKPMSILTLWSNVVNLYPDSATIIEQMKANKIQYEVRKEVIKFMREWPK